MIDPQGPRFHERSVSSAMCQAVAAKRALELDPDSAEAHASLGMLASNRLQWQQAENRYRRALELQLLRLRALSGRDPAASS